MIASGTTSKQLSKETDAKVVGYGGMLLESFVAVTSLSTLLLLTIPQAQELRDPNQIFASGIATFLNCLGINREFALNFALLAFATFVYDTLDVATRLGRYIFEELTGLKNKWSPYIASLATLILPFIFLTRKITDAEGKGAYPIASFTWILLDQTPQDKERGRIMVDFMKWALTDGQADAADLRYAPLPKAIVDQELQALSKVQLQ